MSICDKIRFLIKQNSFTLKYLHTKTGLSISFLSDIENKRRNPSIENLKLLADTFGVTVNELISDKSISLENKTKKKRDYSLNEKEQKNIDVEAQKILDELSMSFSKNKDILTDEDYFAIENALKITLESIKIKNKKKFTPNKYK